MNHSFNNFSLFLPIKSCIRVIFVSIQIYRTVRQCKTRVNSKYNNNTYIETVLDGLRLKELKFIYYLLNVIKMYM